MKFRSNSDEFDIYYNSTISDSWKRKRLGDKTMDLLDDILLPVAYRTQEMCFSKLGFKVSIQTIHKHPLCEDLFNRNFERAAESREGFDPDVGVPIQTYIRMTLKFADTSLENWDSKVTPSAWARRRLFKVRDQYPMNKGAQRKAWIADGGDGLEFDVLDSANWDRVHTLPFEDFDGGEISWVPDVDSETAEEIVIRKSQLELVKEFMQKLEDENRDIDRQIMKFHYEGKSAEWIVGKLDLRISSRTVRRTIKRLEEEAQKYCNPTLFDTGGD